jgi:tetratricopeptide (TPR) repeat protein
MIRVAKIFKPSPPVLTKHAVKKLSMFSALMLSLLLNASAAAEVGVPRQPTGAITADQQYRFAEALFIDGEYDLALVEFKRFRFLFPDDDRNPHAALRIGQSHARLGNVEAAATALKSVSENYPESPAAMSALFLLSDVYRRSGQPGPALINYRNMLSLYAAPGVRDEIRYRMAWVYIETGQWQQAVDALDTIGPVGRDDLPVIDLKAKVAASENIPEKNPSSAGALSIIPGLGQLYTERNQDALVAFLINGGLIWAAIEAFDNELYALGTLITVVEVGFYAGNIYGAVGGAHKYNERKRASFIEDLKIQFNVSNDTFSKSQLAEPSANLAFTYSF